MSIVPFFDDFSREIENFKKSMFSDDFGMDFFPRDILEKMRALHLSFFNPQFFKCPFENFHQFANFQSNQNEKLTIDKNGFQLTFDTKEYKPSELSVKTFDNYIVVEGKHEDHKDDHNFTKKYFSRTYLLPSGYNPEEINSTISTDGVLCVKVPPPQSAIENKMRNITIKEIGTTYADSQTKSIL